MNKWKVGWGTLSSCNMNCKFCYSEDTRKKIKDLNLSEWTRFVDNNHERISSINYGTGENTMSDDWFTLVHYIRENYPEISQSLTTNGYLSEKIKKRPELRSLVSNAIDEIDISLDFSNPEEHNNFRGQAKAYEWALDTLKFCYEEGKVATIVFLGTNATLNRKNIDGLFKIAEEHNAKLRMNIYRPTNGINSQTKKFIAEMDNIVDTLYYIDEKYKVLAICDPLFNSILTEDNFEDDPSGSSSLRILSDGSITPSTYLISQNFRKANITQGKVLEEIERSGLFVDMVKADIPKECEACNYITKCKGGVFDRRYLWYESFSERDPYCPFRENNKMPKRKINIPKEKNFQSIHDGYLPTMFFSNK